MTKRLAKHTISAIVVTSTVWMSGCVDIHTHDARDAARRLSSRNNMKQITFALLEHYEQQQQWPDGLDELLPLLDNNRAVFENPVTGDNPGYEYVKPSGSLEKIKAAETIVMYQVRNGQRDRKLAVANLDGQVPEP